MPQRWKRELEKWGSIRAPERMRERVAEGPRGDGMPPSGRRGQRVVAAIVAFAVFGAAMWLVRGLLPRDGGALTSPTPTAAATVVPDLSGMTELDAYETLRTDGFIPIATELPGTPGVVSSTQPLAGSTVEPNTTVMMYVGGTVQDNGYSGTSWLDRFVGNDPRYIGSYTDPGGIPVAVVSSRTRAEVHGDVEAIAAGRPFFTQVCVSVGRAQLEAVMADLRDPATTPVPHTVDARMFVDPASCTVLVNQRDVPANAGNRLLRAYPGLVGVEDLRGVSVATR